MSEPATSETHGGPYGPATRLDDADVARLLEARLHDPRRVLGMRELDRDHVVIRAILPYAVAAELVEPSATLHRVGSTALFEWVGPRTSVREPYRLRWQMPHGDWIERYDPYSFPLSLDEGELARFGSGEHDHSYRLLGARHVTLLDVAGVLFSVWAPNAERVSLIGDFNGWDGRCHPMTVRGQSGVWELFMPEFAAGEIYKFEIRNRDTGNILVKIDPYARGFEHRPANASVVEPESRFDWGDAEWLSNRAGKDWHHEPISIYELHLGSWRRGAHGEFLNYRDLADYLAPYVADLGFTHVELMPITEHPLDDSWGYQCTGYYAPTRRHGSPDDFRAFVSTLHEHGIGVILDWVPGHFPRDGHALARFDGTNLFEYGDTRKGEHPDWGTLVFDYARSEVQSFLLSSAIYWLNEFHCDGLRVDAVASMIYLDYSRKDGEWAPNAYGGNENLEAIAFLKRLNELTHGVCPGTLTFAEESTAWPQVSHPTYAGGLGFSFKWNMGWMHDTLVYISKDAVHRRFHHNLLTFGPIYAFTENFVLPLSHDEVVHGKRSLFDKMPGDDWQRFANLRLLLAYQWTYPGKKLLFMGGEFAQHWEWNARESLPWHTAGDPPRAGVTALVRDLNRLYRSLPALHVGDHDPRGFAWLSWQDDQNSVLSFLRRRGDDHVVVLLNFTPVPRPGYRAGVPHRTEYEVLLNSDSAYYGGSNWPASGAVAEPVPCMGHDQSIVVSLPPLGALVLAPKR